MKKLALILCLSLALTGCGPKPLGGGQVESSPTAAQTGEKPGVQREEPTPSSTPTPTPEPSEDPAAGTVVGEDYDYSQVVPQSQAAEEDYFADAVFVGDSRTEGFRLYSGLTQGDYLAHTGLMIFRIYKTQVTVEGEKMTVLQALEKKQYKKVYISLGVNELGMYNDKGYHDNFVRFLEDVKALQPTAVIYLQLNIPVNSKKCAEKGQPDYVTNEQIGIYNDILREVAQEEQVFLLDPAEAMVDETGEPPYDLTADGVHFQKEGYQLWYQYLLEHTVAVEEEKGEGI